MADKDQNNKQLLRYTGLAMQFLVGIGLCVFLGIKADAWMRISIPLLVWLLPLLFIGGMFYKIIKDTSTKK